MADQTDLLTAVATDLRALVYPSTVNKIFTNVLTDAKQISPETFYTLPCGVLSMGEMASDPEEPDLGIDRVFLDVYLRDNSTPGGKEQTIGEKGANKLRQIIKDNYFYKAGDDYMAALSLIDMTAPEQFEVQNRGKVWTFRATYEVLRG